MRTIHVGIRHDDDFSIPELGEVEIFADGRAQSGDNRHQLFVAIDLVNPSLFDVQHLAPKRQDCLIAAISALFCRTTCGIPFDNVNFCAIYAPFRAVSQLARQRNIVHCRLSTGQIPCLLGSFSCFLCRDTLVKDGSCNCWVFFEEVHELFCYQLFNKRFHGWVAQSALGLSLKFAFRQLNGDNGSQSFPHIVAQQAGVVFQEIELLAIFVHNFRQGILKTNFVRTAIHCVNIVGE